MSNTEFGVVMAGFLVMFLLGVCFGVVSVPKPDAGLQAEQHRRDACSCVVNAQKQYLEVTGGLK